MISSFYPVIAGRVSDGLARNRALYQVQSDQSSLQSLQTQLATGLKFQKPSEAPAAAIRVMDLQREQEFKDQTLVNLSSARSYLNTSEASLADAQNILNEVKGISLESVSNVLTESEREAMIVQLDSYLNRMVAIGNQRSRDRYLFAGGSIDQVPIEFRNDVTRFSGDDLDLVSIGDRQDYITHNVTSQRALGVTSEGVTGSVDVNPAISQATRLADLNQGFGIGTGAIQFSDGTSSVVIDLTSAETLGDVIDKINQQALSGRPINAALNENGLVINYVDALPGTLRVTDAGSARIAKNLGIATSVANPALPIVGDDLNPIVRGTTLISDLNGGLGFDITSGFTIHQNGIAYTMDFSGATTVENLINEINNSGASVIADIAPNGRSLRIRSRESGSDFSIAENGTGTLAEDLGLRTFHGQVRLSELNHGLGISLVDGNDLAFTRSDGTEFGVDINAAVTIQDVIDLVNNHPDNQDPALKISVTIHAPENGLRLTSPVPPPPDPLIQPPPPPPVPIGVRSTGGSNAATSLGLAEFGESTATSTIVAGEYVITGRDVNPQETTGVFNSIIRLKNAIRNQNAAEIGRASQMLDDDIDRISLTRGDLGIRQQRIDSLQQANEDQAIELKSRESEERDVDLAEIISQLNARQAAYEANLQLLSRTIRTTIFDYI